jgi:hypothetical protein
MTLHQTAMFFSAIKVTSFSSDFRAYPCVSWAIPLHRWAESYSCSCRRWSVTSGRASGARNSKTRPEVAFHHLTGSCGMKSVSTESSRLSLAVNSFQVWGHVVHFSTQTARRSVWQTAFCGRLQSRLKRTVFLIPRALSILARRPFYGTSNAIAFIARHRSGLKHLIQKITQP